MAGRRRSSRLPGFYRLSVEERISVLKEFAGLTNEEVGLLRRPDPLPIEMANRMVENVVGVMTIPFGVAVNFQVNGRELLVPMVTEEPSVIAAASNAARMARAKGGFRAMAAEPLMIGQIQVRGVKDLHGTMFEIMSHKSVVLERANRGHASLTASGGGARDLTTRVVETTRGSMLVVELLVDCRDAMGANIVNTMTEAVAPLIEKISGGRASLRIISNLAVHRLARAKAVFAKKALGGEKVVDAIIDAYHLAASDPFRCTTHNKGIMNGVTAVVLATGNDTRAIEAGAHAYAARLGRYTSLTTWAKNAAGDLVGTIEMPMAVGIIGGATRSNPTARLAIKILGVKNSKELAKVIVSVGLAQNLAALKALVTEGIQRGHMELHARNIAISAGAVGEHVDRVASQMIAEGRIRLDRAKEILAEVK